MQTYLTFKAVVWPIIRDALFALWAAFTMLALAMRRIPRDKFTAFEVAYPRLGSLARACRKAGTDIVPFVTAVIAAIHQPEDHEEK